MHEALKELLKDEAARSLVHSACVASACDMKLSDPAYLTQRVKDSLIRTAVLHAAEHKLLDAPDAVTVRENPADLTAEFRTKVFLMTPAELAALLQKAFEAGRCF